jgi:hypothetical protein
MLMPNTLWQRRKTFGDSSHLKNCYGDTPMRVKTEAKRYSSLPEEVRKFKELSSWNGGAEIFLR